MTALITAYTGDGCVGRCDAKCYNAWGPECHCICQSANHGAGRQEAIENTRELGESLLEEVLTASGARVNQRDPGVRVHLTVRLPGGEGR
jgi:hypothetical protein